MQGTVKVTTEVCVESPASALAAERGGADRVELCAALAEGGLTPSAATIALTVEKCHAPVMVLVRARRGGFVHDADEIECMARDVAHAVASGAAGVVVGALTRDGSIAVDHVRRMLDHAGPASVTFHRAFDAVACDWREAMDGLMELGVDRVLTSGCAPTAPEGLATLAEMHERAGDDLTVMAGGGVRPGVIHEILETTGIRELHFSAARAVEDPVPGSRALIATRPTLSAREHEVTDEDRVREAVEAARRWALSG